VTSAVFAPNGARILTASNDDMTRLWDRDGKPLAILQGHTDAANRAVFARDGGRILSKLRFRVASPARSDNTSFSHRRHQAGARPGHDDHACAVR
jgi:WD40 repeat protein